ncbi:MAG TPA: (deoxy)nucleoside triphosphate pyrophosphohydrolase [Candidatus Moranbacteria bacterium]|jgi:8-oxo-dGTP diphosphatase|nr:(deoxy)nucleoside triphosphate pyrophosphohydrolase [Candidatus Moranbacteria bacterium]HOF42328.1 (deoxy)nucleoside triphosphate pyrophosphohydrolase [Candidatus Moranbacteria bacterium]HPX94404.1 (deoxy)nucleoside triphosphate pyrophosphohydrolase [Candidatus Moranbacteria bacterium]HQB59414.1 (deoxy)nucleoside triphosphate pyrophosphohydrolase [Candidatus Moranbacteria bacterium]
MKKVAAAIIEQDGKFLIAKRKAGGVVGGKWEFPGGKIEKRESFKEGLKRELKEELDVEVEIGEFFDGHTFHYDNDTIKFAAYTAQCCDKNFNLREHDEIRWVSREEISQLDFVGNDKPILDKISLANGGIVRNLDVFTVPGDD